MCKNTSVERVSDGKDRSRGLADDFCGIVADIGTPQPLASMSRHDDKSDIPILRKSDNRVAGDDAR
jgi:hypothetical protein